MKKFLLMLFVSISLFAALPRVFVWDNDQGNSFDDPETDKRVGCETNIINALNSLGIEPSVGTSLPNADSLIQSYDILYIVNGWNNEDIINSDNRKAIEAFLDTGNCVYLEGNSMAEVYSEVDPTFLSYFGTRFVASGNPNGNIDTLIGAPGSIAEGLKFVYPYGTVTDSSSDELDISDKTVDTLFLSTGRKALAARGSAWDKQESKATKYRTIFVSYEFGAQQSTEKQGSDSTARKVLMERYLAFFGYATTLLVDDDGEQSYDEILQKDLQALDIDYRKYTVSAGNNNGPSVSVMSSYHNVIWLTAKETQWTLTPADTANIADYLKIGGRVFLIGENIVSDMYTHYADKGDLFMLKWFKTKHLTDSVNIAAVYGKGISSGRRSEIKGANRPDQLEMSERGDTLIIYKFAKADPVGGVYSDSAGIKTSIIGYNYGDMASDPDRQGLLQDVTTFFGANNSPVAIQLNAFSCISTQSGVLITFRVENSIGVRFWKIEKRKSGETYWTETASIISSGSEIPKNISYLDNNVQPGRYTYRVGAETEEGIKWLGYENIIVNTFKRNLSYTNVFTKYVTIPLEGNDTVDIFDTSGRKIDTIKGKGKAVWHANNVSAGVYLFKTGNGRKGKIIFIK